MAGTLKDGPGLGRQRGGGENPEGRSTGEDSTDPGQRHQGSPGQGLGSENSLSFQRKEGKS